MNTGLLADIIFALLLVTFVGRGFWRGFSGELFSLAGSIGGVIAAWKLGRDLAELVMPLFDFSPTVVLVIAMVLIYILVAIAAAIIYRLVKALLRFTQLSFIDRVFGGIAGALKTGVIVLFVFFLSMIFSPVISTDWTQESFSMEMARTVWPSISRYLSNLDLPPGVSLDTPGSDRN